MKIISFLNSKGGAGKTTAVINVARGLQLRGASVGVIDTDLHQQSVAQWRQDADDSFFPVDVVDAKRVPELVKNFDVDYLLIDGAGYLDEEIVGVAKLSNLIVIPVKPSPFDYWPAARLFESLTPLNVVTAYLLTQARKHTMMTNEMVQTLVDDGSSFDSIIYNRTAYQFSIMKGETVYEHDKTASVEVDAVIDEILKVI